MKLYDGCYGVLNNGEVTERMEFKPNGTGYDFYEKGKGWYNASGTYNISYLFDGQQDFRSVHPTREEAESAARGWTDKSPFMQGFTDWKSWVAGIVIGLIAAYFLFGCTSPTEPAPCKFHEHTFSHDSQQDTVICLDNSAYGQKREQ